MHRSSQILGCGSFPITNSIAAHTFTVCDLLAHAPTRSPISTGRSLRRNHTTSRPEDAQAVETLFCDAPSRASRCPVTYYPSARPNHALAPSTRRRNGNLQEKDKANSAQRRSISHDAGLTRGMYLAKAWRNPTRKSRQKPESSAWDFFDSHTLEFAKNSRLPPAFFHDLNTLHENLKPKAEEHKGQDGSKPSETLLPEQLQLMESVRKLEEKLLKAKSSLKDSLSNALETRGKPATMETAETERRKVNLTTDDYKNLVDLYFHTHTSRFDPESPHASPTPTFLEDYAFKLSEDFAPPQAYAEFDANDEYESPLKGIERMLRTRQIREISAFKAFVDLLLDDHSSNAALFRAYKQLPQPGVAFLPVGTVRVLLQRMSTPWQKSEKSMVRYLSLIDDMQKANLPITRSEWASAIYLAGRSFSKVTESEVNAGFRMWKQMEQEAGVKAHHVTFNILFDIAVRANKFPLAQMILKEMHDRRLQLNRLGRVSIIYYHGLRGDGDAVRKAYRDFVDAGEIVDTLVLNCVMAALYNAQEPAAAEQIYERMKNLHVTTRRELRSGGSTAYYRLYPGPGSGVIDRELAANSLHRTLLFSRRLKGILPEHHTALQEIIPLRPNHVTYRTMISYHANVSGNLNRITVLISEMSELFGLSMQSIHYQLLFKGFALHGATKSPDATWSLKRLKMAWESCWQEIRAGQLSRRPGRMAVDASTSQLPAIQTINEAEGEQTQVEGTTGLKRLSEWDEFVLDLAAFPRERRKHIERIHAELFDMEEEKKQPIILHPFSRRSTSERPPQKQDHYYPLGERRLDEQEGEYVLPSPFLAIDPSSTEFHDPFFPRQTSPPPSASPVDSKANQTSEPEEFGPNSPETIGSTKDNILSPSSDAETDEDITEEDAAKVDAKVAEDDEDDSPPIPTTSKHQVEATRALICWLLRAYANSTGSRSQVENLWKSVRKVWRSPDANDQASVIRVLRRCLRNCDRYGPPM